MAEIAMIHGQEKMANNARHFAAITRGEGPKVIMPGQQST
jgi:hypothetical protein